MILRPVPVRPITARHAFPKHHLRLSKRRKMSIFSKKKQERNLSMFLAGKNT